MTALATAPATPPATFPLDHPPIASRWPRYEPDEIEAAVGVLSTGRVNSLVHGEQTKAFEEEFAAYCGAPFAIAVGNGTLALELALRALGVGPGDEVIVPARSFFATVSCVAAVGAAAVFADIDPVSQNIDPRSAHRLITRRTKALICVHLGGWPCDMETLREITREHGLFLIEDCAQAHGATYHGRRAGSFGDAAAFSFCTDKIMSTAGEGGMLLLQDEAHHDRAWAYKDHGKSLEKLRQPSQPGMFRYVHDSFGSNFRLTELQSAIGRRQLGKLPAWLAQRRANAAILLEALGDVPGIVLPKAPEHVEHAFYKFNFLIPGTGLNRAQILRALGEAGVPAAAGTCPDMSQEHAFAGAGFVNPAPLPAAAMVGARNVTLPVDHTLSTEEMQRMGAQVRDCLLRSPRLMERVQ